MPSQQPSLAPLPRVALSLLAPAVGALAIFQASGASLADSAVSGRAIMLGALGLISWFLGMTWYKINGMGLRGGRALYAGIGFAVLGWLALLLIRLFTVPGGGVAEGELARTFFFLLVFEALCTQLWAYGLLFRSVADWRGPLTAVLISGAAFGAAGWLFFGESAVGGGLAALYFMAWGFYYGLIRLRTGSLLGMVMVQPLQVLTVWYLLPPASPPDPTRYAWYYIAAALVFLVIIWRLWPCQESDYRV
jgi:hypothetical protein